MFCHIQTYQFWILAFSTLEFTVLAVPNIGVLYFSLSKHCNSVLLIIRTLEFCAFTFANIGILNFAFSIQCDSVFYISSKHWTFRFWSVFPDIRIQWFYFSKHYMEFWILAFKKIEIQCSAFCKHWNSRILLFEKLHFSVFAYPNIGILDFGFFNIRIQCFGFSKHRNCEFWFFETLELWILAFSTMEFSVLVFPNTACL